MQDGLVAGASEEFISWENPMQATAFRTFDRQPASSSAGIFEGDSHQAITPLLDLALAETNAQGAYLYWFDPVAGSGRVVVWTGLSPIAGTVALEVPGAAIRSHFGRHAPIVLHDAAWSDPRFEALPEFRQSRFEGVVSIPLLDTGRVVRHARCLPVAPGCAATA